MAQYDPVVVKSGIPSVLGTDAAKVGLGSFVGVSTAGLTAGNACIIAGDLTLGKALYTSTSPVVGIFDGTTNSLIQEGIAVALFIDGLSLVAGDAVYVSTTAGRLTNIKPTTGMVHEVGIVVDASASKILLQQKPVLSLP